jgi:hypothetical protein
MDIMDTIDLNTLGSGLPAITPEVGRALAQAGAICFESEGHSSGKQLSIKGKYQAALAVLWPPINDQALRCWNDPEYTTEHGAVAVAILLVRKFAGFSVIERSRKGTGFDYWLGDENDNPFQNMARLEISGIRNGSELIVKRRVKDKLKQTTPSDGTALPAFIIVVEFGTPMSEIAVK